MRASLLLFVFGLIALSLADDASTLATWFSNLDATSQTNIRNAKSGWSSACPSSPCTLSAGQLSSLAGVSVSGSSITSFDMSGVSFSTLSSNIGKIFALSGLTSLTTLKFSGCSITTNSPISGQVVLGPAVATLDISNNGLQGQLPSAWMSNSASASSLKTLLASGNSFNSFASTASGCVLTTVDLSGNRVTASALTSAPFVTASLQYINVNSQQGTTLSAFPNWATASTNVLNTNLQHVDFGKNPFVVDFSSLTWIGNLHALTYLDVTGFSSSAQYLTGSIPTQWSSLTALQTFINNQGGNKASFTGTVVSSWSALTHLELGSVDLSSTLTSSYLRTHYPNLSYLSLDGCSVSSTPDFTSLASKLTYIYLSNNPSSVLSLANMMAPFSSSSPLITLILNADNFNCDYLPSVLWTITSLTTVNIASSHLCGPLPTAIVTSHVVDVRLNQNNLNGTLTDLSARHLNYLYLAENQLCPSNPGDYATWATFTDATSGACACQPSDCQNGCTCNGNIFPCLYQGQASLRPPFFYGDKCDKPCDSHCMTCTGPNNGDCITCNNPVNVQQYDNYYGTTVGTTYASLIKNYHILSGETPSNQSLTCNSCNAKENVDISAFPDFPGVTFIQDHCTPCSAPCDTCYFDGMVNFPNSDGGNGSCVTCVSPYVPVNNPSNTDGTANSLSPADGQYCVNAPTCQTHIDLQEQTCAPIPDVIVTIQLHNSQKSGTGTNIHVTVHGRWGRGTGKLLSGVVTPGKLYSKTFSGWDIGPVKSFDLGTWSHNNDLRFYKVTVQRQSFLVSPVPSSGISPYTVNAGPVRVWYHDTRFYPGFVSIVCPQSIPAGQPYVTTYAFTDGLVDPPTCTSTACACTVLNSSNVPDPNSACYWNF